MLKAGSYLVVISNSSRLSVFKSITDSYFVYSYFGSTFCMANYT